MEEMSVHSLSGMAESSLITLCIRALESQRPDALIKDDYAVALVRQMDQEFSQNKFAKIDDATRVAVVLRNRQIDFYARDFLARYPDAAVIHMG